MVIPSLISQDLQTINEYVRSSKKEDSTGPKRNLLASLYSSPQPHPELSLSSLANLTKRHIPQTSSLISTQSGEMLGNLVHKISAAQSTATLRPTTSDSPSLSSLLPGIVSIATLQGGLPTQTHSSTPAVTVTAPTTTDS